MDERIAFAIVLNKLIDCPMFKGIYDAEHSNDTFMHGISAVMESIAYQISNEVGDNFSDEFIKNMIKSEEYAKEMRHAPSYLNERR